MCLWMSTHSCIWMHSSDCTCLHKLCCLSVCKITPTICHWDVQSFTRTPCETIMPGSSVITVTISSRDPLPHFIYDGRNENMAFFFLSEPQYPRAGSWHILYNLQFCGPLLHLVVCLLHKHMNQAFLGTCESWYMYAAVYFPWLYLHKIGVLVLMIWCKEYSENKCYFISNCSIAGVLTNRLLPTVAKYWEKIL